MVHNNTFRHSQLKVSGKDAKSTDIQRKEGHPWDTVKADCGQYSGAFQTSKQGVIKVGVISLRIILSCLEYLLLFSRSLMFTSLQPHEMQHARLPCPSVSPGVCSNSCSLSQSFHPLSSHSPPVLNLSQLQKNIEPSNDSIFQKDRFSLSH